MVTTETFPGLPHHLCAQNQCPRNVLKILVAMYSITASTTLGSGLGLEHHLHISTQPDRQTPPEKEVQKPFYWILSWVKTGVPGPWHLLSLSSILFFTEHVQGQAVR